MSTFFCLEYCSQCFHPSAHINCLFKDVEHITGKTASVMYFTSIFLIIFIGSLILIKRFCTRDTCKTEGAIKYLLLLGAVYLTLFLVSCRARKVNVSSFKGGFITKYGRYTTESEKYTIDVSENPKGLLKYQVYSQDGTVLIDSNKSDVAIGIYQKWRLYWDRDTKYLWIDSSDRGLYFWVKQSDGSYNLNSITKNSPLVREIPKDMLNNPSANINSISDTQSAPGR